MPGNEDDDEIPRYSERELAELLGVGLRTISRWRAEGVLPRPAYPWQRRTAVPSELLALLSERGELRGKVQIPRRVWLRVLATLPSATPATLDHELRGALRAAARLGYTGSRPATRKAPQ